MNKHELYQLVAVISAAIEVRDYYTSKHQSRVSHLARCIAQELALPKDKIENTRIAATLHDIGKLGVPTAILAKVGELRKEEFALIKQHSVIGEGILNNVDFEGPIATIVRQHHERLDGSGYPDGLTGDQILIESKIVAVADVVESMSSSRAYRQAKGLSAAIDEIVKNRGLLYEPDVVDACCRLYQKHKADLFDMDKPITDLKCELA
ncbi:hypothetical protein CXF85_09740 [Colwellia sp. 75C3]|uniref:HD-GYP domain-containing protein n=1 Tax=Colwellia sp. 75C3 TaxID=888425 RepID=UPI000C34B4B2|nr:HD domain-containing phosphohydrolase [Colwellia sp. 75C3]PKG83779.1 hypothetical protein CXF85_09740 [Colwellia sp. 75C3]